MASITFDGQSFLVDGRRVWLVSGAIHYARVPRAYWGDRIAAARNAGLNCIETPVVWSRHEPRQGQFDFTGENDLRHFVQLIAQAGLHCIIRPGPFIDSGWDMGGLPPWLLNNENVKLRTANQPFLEACSRYINAVAAQLRDLQVNTPAPRGSTQPHAPGPIILLQNESGWMCGDDVLATSYLGELDRYFREAGFTVPIINANQLWQSVEGEIDGWGGYDGLLSHLRQLGTVRPAQPRIVIEFKVGQRRTWNSPASPAPTSGAVVRRIAEALAAGGQVNLDPFHGGTNFGFSAGRDPNQGPEAFVTTSNDAGAPLNELGMPAPSYSGVRRICTFASRFSRVLSHLDPARQPVALLPESRRPGKETKDAATPSHVSVVHAVGSQGGVAFVFADDRGSGNDSVSLLMPDGSTFPVHLGQQSAVWCLLDTRLTGRAQLDYCNLSAFAVVGKVFVCFGESGTPAMLSINGAPLEAVVPNGKSPLIQEHEGVTVIIASLEQIDDLCVDDNGVHLGVTGMDRHNKPIADADARQYTRIDPEGRSSVIKLGPAHAHPAPVKVKGSRPSLGEWSVAPTSEHLDGTSPRYAGIAKPSDLVALGAPFGYGWYRVRFSSPGVRKAHLMFPQAGHRLHVALDGESLGVVGVGPGATRRLDAGLRKGDHTLVALAENLGRVSSGADLGEATGLYGHIWEVEALTPGKPKLGASDPVDILAFRAPLWRLHRDDMTDAQRLTWKFEHRRKTPIIIEIGALERDDLGDRDDGVVLLNGKCVHYFQQGGVRPILLDPAVLAKGVNEIQISMLGSTHAAADALTKQVRFYEGVDCLTIKGEWAFAKWEPPAATAYHKAARAAHGPAWWRSEFHAGDGDTPLLLELAGLTKGQIYVNGRHVGRYFIATAAGKKVPPQTRYVIPRSYLAADGADELVIFDEHGHAPTRCRLINDPHADVLAG